jgi:hypothetical protein
MVGTTGPPTPPAGAPRLDELRSPESQALGLAVSGDDDHYGRSAPTAAVLVGAAGGVRPPAGREDRPGPADMPARQVTARPARPGGGPVTPPVTGCASGDLPTALLGQGLGYFRVHDEAPSRREVQAT